jgi:hypothetical protein
MSCKCEHPDIVSVSAPCGAQALLVHDQHEFFGCLPAVRGLGEGCFMDIDICLNCKCVMNLDTRALKAAVYSGIRISAVW